MKAARVLIIDDHAAVRRGLAMILQDVFTDAEIVGAADVPSAVAALRDHFDLVLCDINLPGRNGIEALKEIKAVQPKAPVLIMSMLPEEQFAIRALKAGAGGYLNKSSEPEELIVAARALMAGRKYISASVAEQMASSLSTDSEQLPHQRLSDREYEVFRMIASGKEVKEVAGELGLSVKTISTHREHILKKMGMKNNAALVVYAVKNGLVD